MDWLAIDIGSFQIKGAILDKCRNIVPLDFLDDNFRVSPLLSEAYIDKNQVVFGEKAFLFGLVCPQYLVEEWNSRKDSTRSFILRELFQLAKQSGLAYYKNDDIGLILINPTVNDIQLEKDAKEIFKDVRIFTPIDILTKTFNHDANGLLLALDFGHETFKISVVNKAQGVSYFNNDTLGFNSINLGHIIEPYIPTSSNPEIYMVYGKILERNLLGISNGFKPQFPVLESDVVAKVQNEYNSQLGQYSQKCLAEVTACLKYLGINWGNISTLLPYGGGCSSKVVTDSISEYIDANAPNVKIIKYDCRPSELVVTNALKMPLRANNGVKVKF